MKNGKNAFNKANLRNQGLEALNSLREGDVMKNEDEINQDVVEFTTVVETPVIANDNAETQVNVQQKDEKIVKNFKNDNAPKAKEKSLSELLDEKFGIMSAGLNEAVSKNMNIISSKVGNISKSVEELKGDVEKLKSIKILTADDVEKQIRAALNVAETNTKDKGAEALASDESTDTTSVENKEEEKEGMSCAAKVGIATVVGGVIGYAIKAIMSSGE